MQIKANCDLPGDGDSSLTEGPVLVRVDLRVSGDLPPALKAVSQNGGRAAFVWARAERLDLSGGGAVLATRLWRRKLTDAAGHDWFIGVSDLKIKDGTDSADAAAELGASIADVNTCRILAARCLAACVIGGARGPISCDTSDVGYRTASCIVRGQDPARPPAEPSTPPPLRPADISKAKAALPVLDAAKLAAAQTDDLADDLAALSQGAALQATLPSLRRPSEPEPVETVETDEPTSLPLG